MPFITSGGLRYYTFESLDEKELTHAVFTRRGGVSPAPWKALNMGGTVGDDPLRVVENRQRAFQAMNRPGDSLYDVWLVHSALVIKADQPRGDQQITQADAIITDKEGVTLFMRFADCVPLLFHDPVRNAIGLAHAGWQGTIKRAASSVVDAMQAAYGSRSQDISAAIGPSIGAHHYPVGEDVAARVRESFGEDASSLLLSQNGEVQFDLWAANRLILEEAGLRRIESSGLCTACHLEDWYSHRAECGKTGRFGVLMGL
jgi:polyphenol oxidase